MTSQPTCEERLQSQLEGRLEDMVPDCPACQEGNCGDHINSESVLEVAQEVWYKIGLSWGGPADFFRVKVSDNEIERIVYHFQDWYDGASLELSGDEFATVNNWIMANVYIEGVM